MKINGTSNRITQSKKRVIRLFLIVFLGAALFIAPELFLRRVWTPPPAKTDQLAVEYDPLYGWRKKSNYTYTYGIGTSVVSESFNSRGLRGPEYSYRKSAGEHRTLILGDSHAEGYSVAFPQLFSETVKKKLNELGRRYEVINAGTQGYSTDQEILFFQNEGKKYQPELVVLMLSYTNIWYNAQERCAPWNKPLFTRRDRELRLTNVPVEEPAGISTYGVRKVLKRHSYVYQFVRHYILHSRLYTWLIQLRLVSRPAGFKVWRTQETRRMQEAWSLTEALLDKFQQEVKGAGSQLLVFYVPPMVSVDEEAWAMKQKKYGLDSEKYDPSQVGRKFASICARLGLDCLEPTEQFRAVSDQLAKKGEKLYFLENDHWTPDGHRLAGKLLADYIGEHYLEERR